jgi:hypothetical protein
MGRPISDLRGKVFGSLTVLKRVRSGGKGAAWLCECRCGNTKIATASALTHGQLRSCGWKCGQRAANRKRSEPRNVPQIPSVHVSVPPREPWEWPGNEDVLAAQYGEGSNANV